MRHLRHLSIACLILQFQLNAQSVLMRTFGGYVGDGAGAGGSDGTGSIFMVGNTSSFLVGTAGICGWITKLNTNGELQWSRNYGQSTAVLLYDVERADNSALGSGLICAGKLYPSQGLLLGTDQNGTLLWYRTSSACTHMQSLDVTLEYGYYAVGSSVGNASDISIYKVTADGEPVWQQQFQTGYEDEAFDITTTPDSGAIVAGSTIGLGAVHDPLLVKFSKDGSPQWSRTYGNGHNSDFRDVINCNDGGYLAVGRQAQLGITDWNPFLLRLDEAGDTLWTARLQGYSDARCEQVLEVPTGFAMLVRHYSNGYNFNITFVDPEGDIISTHEFGANGSDYPSEMTRLPDGRIAIVGSTEYNNGNGAGVGGDDVLLAIVQEDGAISCEIPYDPLPTLPAPVTILSVGEFSTISPLSAPGTMDSDDVEPLTTEVCQGNTGIDEHMAWSIEVYPEPATDVFTVRFSRNEAWQRIRLFDPLGRLVLSRPLHAEREVSVDVGALCPGVYTIEASASSHRPICRRVVIQ